MNPKVKIPEYINDAFKNFACTSKKEAKWVSKLRNVSFKQFSEIGLPGLRDEDWKYTSLKPIKSGNFNLSDQMFPLDKNLLDKYKLQDTLELVFINGELDLSASSPLNALKGVLIEPIAQNLKKSKSLINKYWNELSLKNDKLFTTLNKAFLHDGLCINVQRGASAEKLIHVIYASSGDNNTMSFPRSLIVLEPNSRANILESYVSLDKSKHFTNAITDIHLEENAHVSHYIIQNESKQSSHIGNTQISLEANSSVEAFNFSIGSNLGRNDLKVSLKGQGSHASVNGLYAVNGTQHIDNHTEIIHEVANCTSYQVYKGVLKGEGRAVFNGKIKVAPDAQHTNSKQLNQNLLLSKKAHIDTKPELEIFADDVKCTHGATVGQLDDDHVFYLTSRGIPKKDAKDLLAQGFALNVLNELKNDLVKNHMKELLTNFFLQPDMEK